MGADYDKFHIKYFHNTQTCNAANAFNKTTATYGEVHHKPGSVLIKSLIYNPEDPRPLASRAPLCTFRTACNFGYTHDRVNHPHKLYWP